MTEKRTISRWTALALAVAASLAHAQDLDESQLARRHIDVAPTTRLPPHAAESGAVASQSLQQLYGHLPQPDQAGKACHQRACTHAVTASEVWAGW